MNVSHWLQTVTHVKKPLIKWLIIEVILPTVKHDKEAIATAHRQRGSR